MVVKYLEFLDRKISFNKENGFYFAEVSVKFQDEHTNTVVATIVMSEHEIWTIKDRCLIADGDNIRNVTLSDDDMNTIAKACVSTPEIIGFYDHMYTKLLDYKRQVNAN